MRTSKRNLHVSCALLTPVGDDLSIDVARMSAHAGRVLEGGCDSITLFGTTGEGASFSVSERRRLLEALIDGGLPGERIILAALSAALTDIVELCAAARDAGCRAVLVAPPFYFRDAGEDGILRSYCEVISRLGAAAGPMILYNFPAMSGYRITPAIVARLQAAHPGVIAGLKDSSGEADSFRALLAMPDAPDIYVGAERLLPDAVAAGGAGTISGLANLEPALVAGLVHGDPDAPARARTILAKLADRAFIPVAKATLAERLNDPVWRNVRPPLMPVDQGKGPQDQSR